jgi:DNA helicase-2/ATP-dependent DNA helicase PcrA
MTYHRAKGLEFDAVFLPRLLDGELPFRSGRSRAPEDEERRLLYVGVTRARRHLFVTWPLGSKPRSPFVTELSGIPEGTRRPFGEPKPAAPASPLLDALRSWRRERARSDGVPAYVVFHDSTLAEIADRRPRTLLELRTVAGVGPTKLDRYGPEVLSVVAGV